MTLLKQTKFSQKKFSAANFSYSTDESITSIKKLEYIFYNVLQCTKTHLFY